MPHNPFRVAIRWLADDAFPRCRVVIPGDPPRWEFGLISDWPIPHVQTSEDLAKVLDKIRKGIKFDYSADQLRVLAAQIRKTNPTFTHPMAHPWNSEGNDPYGDPAYRFECDYHGKAGTGTLALWLTLLSVVEV